MVISPSSWSGHVKCDTQNQYSDYKVYLDWHSIWSLGKRDRVWLIKGKTVWYLVNLLSHKISSFYMVFFYNWRISQKFFKVEIIIGIYFLVLVRIPGNVSLNFIASGSRAILNSKGDLGHPCRVLYLYAMSLRAKIYY